MIDKYAKFRNPTALTTDVLEQLGFTKQEKLPKTDQEWHLRFLNDVGTTSTLAAKPTTEFIQWYINHQPFPRQLCVTTVGRLRVICELLGCKLHEIEDS